MRTRAFAALALAGVLGGFASCAPLRQEVFTPASDFGGPRFDVEAEQFVSYDGAALGLTVWAPPGDAAPWAAVVAVHGMSEWADAWHLAAPYWAEHGVIVYAYDQRGFGRSPGRGVWAGTELLANDLETAVSLARARHPDAVVAVVGQSMGAATAMTADARRPAPLADRVILSAPAVRGWSALPWHYRVSLWVAARFAGGADVRPPRGIGVQASSNMEALYRNGRDPLFLHDTRIDMLEGLVGHMQAASRTSPGRDGPTLLLYGANDQVIPEHAVRGVAERMGPCGRSAYYAEGWHMLFRDLQAQTVWDDVLGFLRDPAAPPPSRAPAAPGASVETEWSRCPANMDGDDA